MVLSIEMNNMRGRNVKVDNINFSFYFLNKDNKHNIRVVIHWDRDRLDTSNYEYGILYLYRNYRYVRCKNDKSTREDIGSARRFFKKYKVLFAGVWEEYIEADIVQDYLREIISFKEMIYEIFQKDINVDNIEELEEYVRKNNVFNMND